MMKKLVCLLAVLPLIGCGGCVSSDDVSSDSNDRAPVLVSSKVKNNSAKAVVRVEFVLSRQDVENYPEALEAFVAAAQEWAKVAPLEIAILIPQEGSQETVASLMAVRHGAIILDFMEDIPAPEDKNYLGTFSWASKTLRLDMADMYKPDFMFEKTKSTAMHELGHMFGLTHVYNSGDVEASAGSLIVDRGAEKMLMAPNLPRGQEHHDMQISPAELEYALKYIQTILPTKLHRF